MLTEGQQFCFLFGSIIQVLILLNATQKNNTILAVYISISKSVDP